MSTISVDVRTGADILPILPELAKLRITVFRDWPYLYDGTVDYEEKYLATFAKAPGAICVVAKDGDAIIGASTGAPMQEHASEFAQPFQNAGYDIANVFYCSESVLLTSHRGLGLGHRFFDEREAHAQKLGDFTHTAFCSVIRPEDHPLRPAHYRPLDAFWTKRGYKKSHGLVATYDWKDLDQDGDTTKSLQFWIKPLS